MMKKFGLILPEKKMINQTEPKKVAVASIFKEEDFEDDEEKELAILRGAKTTEDVTKSISTSNEFVEKVHQEALKEDPNIFDYDASIEEDSKKRRINFGSHDKNLKNEPKYMHNILAKAEERKMELELIKLRNMKRKSGAIEPVEEEVFVTAAYKERLKELEEKEKELKLRQIKEEDGDVTKRRDMSGFYYNLLKRNVSFGGGKTNHEQKTKKAETETEIRASPVEEPLEEPTVFGPKRPPIKK